MLTSQDSFSVILRITPFLCLPDYSTAPAQKRTSNMTWNSYVIKGLKVLFEVSLIFARLGTFFWRVGYILLFLLLYLMYPYASSCDGRNDTCSFWETELL